MRGPIICGNEAAWQENHNGPLCAGKAVLSLKGLDCLEDRCRRTLRFSAKAGWVTEKRQWAVANAECRKTEYDLLLVVLFRGHFRTALILMRRDAVDLPRRGPEAIFLWGDWGYPFSQNTQSESVEPTREEAKENRNRKEKISFLHFILRILPPLPVGKEPRGPTKKPQKNAFLPYARFPADRRACRALRYKVRMM